MEGRLRSIGGPSNIDSCLHHKVRTITAVTTYNAQITGYIDIAHRYEF
jgi:hypothetical protein